MLKINAELQKKYEDLKSILEELGSVAVCYSGGVDSTFLLTVAGEVLGDKCLGVLCTDAFVPAREIEKARLYCAESGIRLIEIPVDPMQSEEYRQNTPDRCYYCKRIIMSEVKRAADDHGMKHIIEGSNLDDLSDYRPGRKALKELGVRSPLKESGFTKQDIRDISREMGIPTWAKPAFACLATRIPYGTEISREKLAKIDRAEEILSDLGFTQYRVRMHDNIARIELLPDDIERAASAEVRTIISDGLGRLGFDYVTLDLSGFKSGNMNREIGKKV